MSAVGKLELVAPTVLLEELTHAGDTQAGFSRLDAPVLGVALELSNQRWKLAHTEWDRTSRYAGPRSRRKVDRHLEV